MAIGKLAGAADNAFNWMWGVIDNASGPLKDIGKEFENTEDAAKEAAKVYIKSMKDMGTSIKNFIKSKFSFSSIVSGISSVLQAASDLNDIYLGLGINIMKGSREMANAYKVMGKLEWGLGLTTEAAKSLTNLGQQLGYSGKQLGQWAIAAGEYAKATDSSAEAVGRMYNMLVRVGNVAPRTLRNIGDSMVFVAQATGMSHDRIVTFTESLSKVYAQMPKKSSKATARLTADLQAVAGAFGRELGDPQLISGWMEKMLDPLSKEGWRVKDQLARFTGLSVDEIMKKMETDPVDVFARFSEGLAKIPEKDIHLLRPQLSDYMGMSMTDIRAMQKMATGEFTDSAGKRIKGVRELIKKNRKQMKEQALAADRAARKVNWYTLQQMRFKRSMLKLWAAIGKKLMPMIKKWMPKLIEFLDKKILPALEYILNKLPWGWFADNIVKIGAAFATWKIGNLGMKMSGLADIIGKGAVTPGGKLLGKATGLLGAVAGVGAAIAGGWVIGAFIADLKIAGRSVKSILADMAMGTTMTEEGIKNYRQEYQQYLVKGGLKGLGDYLGGRKETKGNIYGQIGLAAKSLEAAYSESGGPTGRKAAIKDYKWRLNKIMESTSGQAESEAIGMLLDAEQGLRSREGARSTKTFTETGIRESASNFLQANYEWNQALGNQSKQTQILIEVMKVVAANTDKTAKKPSPKSAGAAMQGVGKNG